MKQITCTILAILLFLSGFSQQVASPKELVNQDYLQKSKNQKIAAWVMLGVGTGMTVGAIAWATQDILGPDQGEGALLLGGVCLMAGSVPLFIISGKNKKKANNITVDLKVENSIVLQQTNFSNKKYPALLLKLKL